METNKLFLLRKLMGLIEARRVDDEILKELVEFYNKVSSEKRDEIRKKIDKTISGKLMMYSHLCAVESVRKKSKQKLMNGLISQSIEDGRVDYRDNTTVLFLLYNSAKRLGESPKSLIEEIIKLSSERFAIFLRNFINRKDLDSDILKLSGYKIVEYPEFDYVWDG